MMIIVDVFMPMRLAMMMVVRVRVAIIMVVTMARRIGSAQLRDCRVRFVRTSAGGTHREYLYLFDSQSVKSNNVSISGTCRGNRNLPKTDASVVGGHPRVGQYAKGSSIEPLNRSCQQELVLEHAAA